MPVLEKPVEPDEFMCDCEEEGKQRCADVRARAKEIVEKRAPCDDDFDYVDRLLYWLSLDGDIGIAADQWACVSVSPFEIEDPEVAARYEIKERTSMMCDSIVDGLAAAVVYHFGEEHA